MEMVDNSIILNGDVTDELWDEALSLVTDGDDISLKIINGRILVSKLIIPNSISAISIEACVFTKPTVISGLDRGRFFCINKCSRNFLIGTVTIKNISCRVFNFTEEKPKYKNYDLYDHISPQIESCIFHHCIYTSTNTPVFNSVFFIDSIKYISYSMLDKESLFFNNCNFCDYLKIEVYNFKRLSISISESKVVSSRSDIEPNINFMSRDTLIESLSINNSKLKCLNFNFFKQEIEKIDISESELGSLDLHTVDDEHAPKRIYSISIIKSKINKLLLNNRHNVHPLLFSGSMFQNPPQFFGSNVPHGSSFPDKKGFVSRCGDKDASCYRTLRFSMESQRNREFEGMFFTLEQESILNKNKTWKKYFSLNYLYSLFSNYGTDHIRPLLILFMSLIFFTIAYSLLASPNVSPSLPIDWDIIEDSFIFSLKQALQPFSSLKDMSPLLDKSTAITLPYAIVCVVNSILSISCLALSGLAIRWKFKRG